MLLINTIINSIIKKKKKNIKINNTKIKNIKINTLIKKNLLTIKNKHISLIYLNNKCLIKNIKKKINI